MQRCDIQLLNTQQSISDWIPALGGLKEIQVGTLYSKAEFSSFLSKMRKHYSGLPIRHRPHLSFNPHSPTKDAFSELISCAQVSKETLPFSELTLFIDELSLLQNQKFEYEIIFNLMKALNETSIQRLHLIIPNAQVMAFFLKSECLQKIYYPVTMGMRWGDEEKKLEELYSDFWKSLILRRQERNKFDPAYLKKRSQHGMEDKKDDEEESVCNDPDAPKIKLKELITQHLHDQVHNPVYDDLIDVEEQHVEQEQVMEQVVEAVIEEEVVVAEQVEEEQQQQEEQYAFGLPLIDYREFKEKYLYLSPWGDSAGINSPSLQDVGQELFAGLSDWGGAIQWLSPAAASVLAKHLSVFISLNLDNLPPNFLIKERMYDPRYKTKNSPRVRGDSVLDYDPLREPQKTNAYTPKEALRHDSRKEPVYPISIVNQVSQELRENLKCIAFIQQHEAHFINMWIYHGDKGVLEFCDRLMLFETEDREAMKECLLDNYLKHFPHWDHFLDDNSFFECLDKINNYTFPQRTCLQKFLKNTGVSHHDLSDTLTGFDEFWKEWTQLCKTHNIDSPEGLGQANWHTRYGHPVVYMERLITILKNARDLEEQIDCLEGITLNSYGLYCDSRYRNFKIVSYEMQDSYNRLIMPHKNKAFREDNAERTVRQCYRKIGQQLKSIPVKKLVASYESYESLHRYDRSHPEWVLDTALFFLQHKQYAGQEDIIPALFEAVEKCNVPKSELSNPILSTIHKHLQQLLDQGCFLSPAEGILIFEKIQKEYGKQYHTYDHGRQAMENLCKKIEDDLFKPLQEFDTRAKKLKVLANQLYLSDKVKTHLNYLWNDGAQASNAQEQAEQSDQLWQALRKQPYFKKHQRKLDQLFVDAHFDRFPYGIRFQLLTLLQRIESRHYDGILEAGLKSLSLLCGPAQQPNASLLLKMIQDLHEANFPSHDIIRIVDFVKPETLENVRALVDCFLDPKLNDHPGLTQWIIRTPALSLEFRVKIAYLTKLFEHHRDAIKKLFMKLEVNKQLSDFLKIIYECPSESQAKILEIIACRKIKKDPVDYAALVMEINKLEREEIEQLYQFFKTRTGSASALMERLRTRGPAQSFSQLLEEFEKAPFGVHDLADQADIAQGERVVNGLLDMHRNRLYPYAYRKQVMEAFYFINEAGHRLKIYKDKFAKELSDNEIKVLFREVKEKKPDSLSHHLTPFQRQLLALGLIREAVYRTTGEFPYSTQIISVIDCMMQAGNVLSNIDTGQGKSLIDAMKAALLWINSRCVCVSTASIVDAKRDIETYAPFFSLLGIPCAKMPIVSASSFEDYQTDGVNYIAMSSFALFYLKAKLHGREIGQRSDQEEKKEDDEVQPAIENVEVSLVLNESDHTLLEDVVIYRCATSSGAGAGSGNEWVYTAINIFVQQAFFKRNDTSADYDIFQLKKYLKKEAGKYRKSPSIVESFSQKQLLKWITSAIFANYRLRVNHDYVLALPEEKPVKGMLRLTRSAKILMKDGKISRETQYGNGMHQLVHAKSNTDLNTDEFVIEQESKTIISINNLVMMRYYLSRGIVWGSSGTLGDKQELEWLYRNYGFAYSKIEPHQEKKVISHEVQICKDEAAHFERLRQCIQASWKKSQAPILVFLKDIDTVKKFFEGLKKLTVNSQSYTGLEREEDVVQIAAKPQYVTVTTQALGRNTDVLYDKAVGMVVIQGFTDTPRKGAQRSGRTGRQGSPGENWIILNEQDLQGKTLEDIANRLESEAQHKREFNNELYGVLGFLLEHVGVQNQEFFVDRWADFTSGTESRYREMKVGKTYTLKSFVDETVRDFNQLVQPELYVTQEKVLSYAQYTYPPIAEEEKAEDEQPVLIGECTPPETIAQSLFEPFLQAEYRRLGEEVKKQMAEKAVACEKERERLTEEARREEGKANQFALQVEKSKRQAFENLKQKLVASLINYSKQWFVNANRKQAALELIEMINAAENDIRIIGILQEKQLAMIQVDIAKNKTCWRKIKPLHSKGYSRFHQVLNSALHTVAETGQKAEEKAEEKSFAERLRDNLGDCDQYNKAVINKSMIAARAEAKLAQEAQAIFISVAEASEVRQKAKTAHEKAEAATKKAEAAKAAYESHEQIQAATQEVHATFLKRIHQFKHSWQSGGQFQLGLFGKRKSSRHPVDSLSKTMSIAPP